MTFAANSEYAMTQSKLLENRILVKEFPHEVLDFLSKKLQLITSE